MGGGRTITTAGAWLHVSWLGDMERADPAYPGSPADPSTTSWSQLECDQLNAILAEEDAREAAARPPLRVNRQKMNKLYFEWRESLAPGPGD